MSMRSFLSIAVPFLTATTRFACGASVVTGMENLPGSVAGDDFAAGWTPLYAATTKSTATATTKTSPMEFQGSLNALWSKPPSEMNTSLSREEVEMMNRNGNVSTTVVLEPWYVDLMNLPDDVGFPGFGWLDRMALDDAGVFRFDDPTTGDVRYYPSVYAALVDADNLPYARHVHCRNLNAYVNSVAFSNAAAAWFVRVCGNNLTLAHYAMGYFRNLVAGIVLYFLTAGTFHYWIYVHPSTSRSIFEDRNRPRPNADIIWHQIRLSMFSTFFYVLMPLLDELCIEHDLTKAYYTVSDVGGIVYCLAWMVPYFSMVEIGIYWVHRILHTNKFLYKHVHLMHHYYKTPELLTPWASVAFHPLDGMLQASPYLIVLFFIPCHYISKTIMLFFTEVWATYIHDAMDWDFYPIMGSRFHTVHHTHYMYNFGQIFIFCDQYWGTLRTPKEPTGISRKKQPQQRQEKAAPSPSPSSLKDKRQ